MKKIHIAFIVIKLLLTGYFVSNAFDLLAFGNDAIEETVNPIADNDLKQAAFELLDAKCNVCHRKQNPFKIFSLKNMEKYAAKIHKQVFVLRRMPKGDQIKLTDEEYQLLQDWLTINI